MYFAGRYDVIVAGGGAAGVGAAIGAARCGARTLIVERAPFLGGAATWSSVATYCGFWTQGEPPLPAVGGAGAEVLRALGTLGLDVAPVRMASSGVVVALIDPEAVKFALDRLTASYGIDVLLHATITGASSDGRTVRSMRIAGHGDPIECAAHAYVDASGEADLAWHAGAATRYGDGAGRVQSGTLVVRFGGIDPNADVARGTWERAVRDGKARGIAPLSKEHGFVARLQPSGDVFAFLADESYDARDLRALAGAEQRARAQAWALLEAVRALPGHAGAYLAGTGPAIGTRESRHVIAPYRLRTSDVVHRARFDDAIAVGAWPVERHPGGGERSTWQRIDADGSYEIPLRSICSASHDNLFCAGRVLDAEPDAFGSVRVMGTAFATGHAAGVAAAARAAGAALEPAAIRATLQAQGAIVDAPERTLV